MASGVSGGDAEDGGDIALVLTVVLGRSLCLECIAKKCGLPVPRASALLGTIAGSLKLNVGAGPCDGCLEPTQRFRLDSPASDAPRPRSDETTRRRVTQHAILRFLREHAGQAFCADCISTRVLGGKSIDVAMRHLEGNGVDRRHGPCAGCGKRRLLARLPSG